METHTNLSEEDLELIEAAKETSDRLHIDNIHEVAAALRTSDKKIFTGIHMDANVGFADLCGEVAAICHAVAHGHRDYEAIVALIADGEGRYRILSPCGRCREVISDFSEDIWVILGTLEEPFKVKVSDLLPMKYKRTLKYT
jgi:cytidine deaminase